MLLGEVEVSVLLLERELRKRPPLGLRELLRPLDALGEPFRHRAKRELGVDVQSPGHVDGGEENVAQLLEDVRIGLGLGRRLTGLGQSFAELAQLVLEIGKRAGRVRVLEVDGGGATLELPGVEQRGKRLGDMVEDPIPLLLLRLDPLPVLADPDRSARLDLAEDMRVPADELLLDSARDRFERAGASLLQEQRQEVSLKEEVTELVLELGVVAGEGGVRDFVGLFDRVRDDRPRRLLPIPRAIAPEALGQLLEIEECVCERALVRQRASRSRARPPRPWACSRPGTTSRPSDPCASWQPTSPCPCCASPG